MDNEKNRKWKEIQLKATKLLEFSDVVKPYLEKTLAKRKREIYPLYNDERLYTFFSIYYEIYQDMIWVKELQGEKKFIYFPGEYNCRAMGMILIISNSVSKYYRRLPLYLRADKILKNAERYEKDLQELLDKKDIDEDLKNWAQQDFLKYSEIEYMLRIIL